MKWVFLSSIPDEKPENYGMVKKNFSIKEMVKTLKKTCDRKSQKHFKSKL